MTLIRDIAALEAIYGLPAETATAKEVDRLIPAYRALIAASPFVALATVGPEGLDCSPRGDRPAAPGSMDAAADPGRGDGGGKGDAAGGRGSGDGVVRIVDDRTLMLPDRRGNNRIDSLRNIVRDGRVALLFLIPGSGTTLRVNGRAVLSVDPGLLAGFAVDGAPPRTVIVVTVESVYFQCARAILRADLWNPALHVPPGHLPTPGQILAELSAGRVGGEPYDSSWPARAAGSMW